MSTESRAVRAYKVKLKQMVDNYRRSQELAVIRYEASLGQAAKIYEVVMRAKAGKGY